MTGIPELFLTIAAIIFIGFVGNAFFERTKISDVLVLFIVGLLIGPVFGIVDQTFFVTLIPFFASLALIIILFDGGLHLNLFKVLKELSKAFTITSVSFLFTVIFIGAVLHFIFDWNLLISLLLGAAVGGTSSAIVIPLINKVSGNEETKTLLQIESALTDALVVVVAIALIQIIVSQNISFSDTANALFGAFSIAAVVGIIAGIAWMKVLRKLGNQKYGYLLTLGLLFALYGFVEAIRGNGAISALMFGMILGNTVEMAKMLKMQGNYEVDDSIRKFQSELTFFVRTFFFVYLGVIFNLGGLTVPIAMITIAVIVALIAARIAAIHYLTRKHFDDREKSLMKIMMPRGLAAAVIATFPISAGITPDKFPEIALFAEIILLVVLLSNITTTIGIFWYERKYKILITPRKISRKKSMIIEDQ